MASYLADAQDGTSNQTEVVHDSPPSTPRRSQRGKDAYRTRLRHTPTHRPLITAAQASSTHSRFQALFSTALSPRVSPRECSRFIDRFRYVICTSQLLSENIVHSDANKRKNELSTYQFEDGEQGKWDSRKAAKYWMGSGGCIVLISMMIVWALRSSNRGIPSTAKSSATLVLALLLALYLYAQSRRAYTRHLHHKAATLIQNMVSHCQNFDYTTCRMITLIQEVELVSRGYKIGNISSPIARIEANCRQRRCMRLRTTVVSALNLVFAASNRSSAILEQLTNVRDFNKLSDVYNIIVNDEDDMTVLCDDTDSVEYIRALFHQVHSRRRKLLCCLLAVQADGRPGNTKVWTVVAEQLQVVSNLLSNLADQLDETLKDDAYELSPNQIAPPIPQSNSSHMERRRHQARGINNLSQSLRRTQAKMYILREESSRLLQQPDLGLDVRDELLSHYDSLESDLHELLADWREGRQMLLRQGTPETSPEPSVPGSVERETMSTEDDDLDSKTVLIRPNSLGFWGPRMSIRDFSTIDTTMTSPIEDALREEIFEGETESAMPRASRPSMTRAERIAVMRQEREVKQAKSMERLQQDKARSSLQGELKDVLGHRARRPLGLRLGLHNQRHPQPMYEASPDALLSPPLAKGDRKVSTASQQSSNTNFSADSGMGRSITSRVHMKT